MFSNKMKKKELYTGFKIRSDIVEKGTHDISKQNIGKSSNLYKSNLTSTNSEN